MTPQTAADWVRMHEREYLDGLRTGPELCTVYLRIAGEFSAQDVFDAMDKQYLSSLLDTCREIPIEEDFFIFNTSQADMELCYRGLCHLNSFATQSDLWDTYAQPIAQPDAHTRAG